MGTHEANQFNTCHDAGFTWTRCSKSDAFPRAHLFTLFEYIYIYIYTIIIIIIIIVIKLLLLIYLYICIIPLFQYDQGVTVTISALMPRIGGEHLW